MKVFSLLFYFSLSILVFMVLCSVCYCLSGFGSLNCFMVSMDLLKVVINGCDLGMDVWILELFIWVKVFLC